MNGPVDFKKLRCPHCNSQLVSMDPYGRFCQQCAGKLPNDVLLAKSMLWTSMEDRFAESDIACEIEKPPPCTNASHQEEAAKKAAIIQVTTYAEMAEQLARAIFCKLCGGPLPEPNPDDVAWFVAQFRRTP